MEALNQIALLIGWAILLVGGLSLAAVLVWWLAEEALKRLAHLRSDWFDVACEMHRQRKFRWQKPTGTRKEGRK